MMELSVLQHRFICVNSNQNTASVNGITLLHTFKFIEYIHMLYYNETCDRATNIIIWNTAPKTRKITSHISFIFNKES